MIGRLFFRTKEMIQGIDSPDIVRNRVSFSAFGFLDGDVSLTGELQNPCRYLVKPNLIFFGV